MAGKYYLSSALGSFVIYVVLIAVLVLRPQRPVRARAMKAADASLARRARWRLAEIVFWLVAFAAIFAPAGKHCC